LNVRVLLFPDGEDPDSYSRKVGTTEFQKFLKDHTQDFVSFKINLQTKEINNDPIKKSNSLREIADTLSLLKDEVRRAPYYRQVKDLLQIDEGAIINEINKIRIRRDRDEKAKLSREAPSDLDLAENVNENEVFESISILAESQVYAQERETVRLLMKFANDSVDEEQVHEFLLTELSDVEFSHPVYRRIVIIIKERLNSENSIDLQYLLSINDKEINKFLSEILVDKYVVSPLWLSKYNIFVPAENEKLNKLVNSNVLRFKFRVVQKMLEGNLREIKDAELVKSEKVVDALLDVREGLNHAEQELAKLLGIVIAK